MASLLSQLHVQTTNPRFKWVARWSFTGRGFRLHQFSVMHGELYADEAVGDTPSEALEKFLAQKSPRVVDLMPDV